MPWSSGGHPGPAINGRVAQIGLERHLDTVGAVRSTRTATTQAPIVKRTSRQNTDLQAEVQVLLGVRNRSVAQPG